MQLTSIDSPPSFFQVLHLSGQGKYIGLIVGVVSAPWYQRRYFNFHRTNLNPAAKNEYVALEYDYPFDQSHTFGRRQIVALKSAALNWFKHHNKEWRIVQSRLTSP